MSVNKYTVELVIRNFGITDSSGLLTFEFDQFFTLYLPFKDLCYATLAAARRLDIDRGRRNDNARRDRYFSFIGMTLIAVFVLYTSVSINIEKTLISTISKCSNNLSDLFVF